MNAGGMLRRAAALTPRHPGARGLMLPALRLTAAEVASRPVKTIEPRASVGDALEALGGGKIGALAVADPGDGHRRSEFHGMVTERDFLTKTAVDGGTRFAMFEPEIRELMTPAEQVAFAQGNWTLLECLGAMLDGGFRHLPIMGQRGVEAMLSLRDIAHAIIADGVPAVKSTSTVGEIAARAMGRRPVGRSLALPPSIATVPRGASVAEAVKEMRTRRVGSVLIPSAGATLGESRHAFGIFTERDYLKLISAAAAEQSDPRQKAAASFATPHDRLRWVDPHLPALDVLHLMISKGMRHVPVLREPAWLWRPGMGSLQDATSVREPPTLLAVVSMRELCAHVLSVS